MSFKNTQTRLVDTLDKNSPHKVSRPKAREQHLSSEMTKDEYLKQERERASTKKK